MAASGETPHDEDDETPLEEAVTGAVIGLTFLVGFGLLAFGVRFFWVAFVVGFAGLLPMALGLVRLYENRRERAAPGADLTETENALEALRNRYARGEISEAEFEQRVERLLETETVDDAKQFANRRAHADQHRSREPEREPEHESYRER